MNETALDVSVAVVGIGGHVMRVAVVWVVILVTSLSLSAQGNEAAAGKYLSSIDNRTYELRTRGAAGLDIYSADGRIVAVMDLDKASGQFKGETSVLATNCPKATGKIETVAIDAERVRMRVETPSQNIATKAKTCGGVVIGKRPFAEFHLIRQARANAATPVPAEAAGAAEPGNSSATVPSEFRSEGIKFDLIEAKASGSTVTLRVMATNEGDDRIIMICNGGQGGTCGGSGVTMFDSAGNSYIASRVTVGNKEKTSLLVNGIATEVTLDFVNLPTRGGVIQATQIAKADFRAYVYSEGKWGTGKLARGEFRNREITK